MILIIECEIFRENIAVFLLKSNNMKCTFFEPYFIILFDEIFSITIFYGLELYPKFSGKTGELIND
jgi:hypothetical protein